MIIWMSLVVLIGVIFYWAINFTLLYHLSRFGVGTLPKRLAGVLLFGSVAIFFITSVTFSAVDFKALASNLSKLHPYSYDK